MQPQPNTTTTATEPRKTQAAIIRDHLVSKGSITQMEASGLYCITDLAGRIRDIRNAHSVAKGNFPFDVVSEAKGAPNGTRYVRYHNADTFDGTYIRKMDGNGFVLVAE